MAREAGAPHPPSSALGYSVKYVRFAARVGRAAPCHLPGLWRAVPQIVESPRGPTLPVLRMCSRMPGLSRISEGFLCGNGERSGSHPHGHLVRPRLRHYERCDRPGLSSKQSVEASSRPTICFIGCVVTGLGPLRVIGLGFESADNFLGQGLELADMFLAHSTSCCASLPSGLQMR
ncbi:hypothetical protein NDU88_005542 [Pleurodeles waltl]|uniref:Uncharacterized protein n=1 Tax=Pleurodeles waltl TaxID=8319 RepID=A0AAV7TBC1_PLEWA|nr:hypothetical protein NDU88_005542 [Pleurodeles waltl]